MGDSPGPDPRAGRVEQVSDADHDIDLARIYDYRFRGVDPSVRADVWSAIARYVWIRAGRPERVLDPAAGIGEFIAEVPAPERWAVDLVDHGLSQLPGVETRIASVFDVDLPEDYFDLVFVSNLLEHFDGQDAVARFLRSTRRLVRPGGRILVMGPNFRYCMREYFDFADHVVPLTHLSVAEHLHGAGYEVGDVVPKFLPYSFRKRLPASRGLASAYLRLRPLWRIFGKQFLVEGIRID